jgi:hypothetical protein
MRERLEKLRSEGNHERPALRIPAPDTRYDPRRDIQREQEEPDASRRGVCIVDINFP